MSQSQKRSSIHSFVRFEVAQPNSKPTERVPVLIGLRSCFGFLCNPFERTFRLIRLGIGKSSNRSGLNKGL